VNIAIRNRAYSRVVAAMEEVTDRLPYPMVGLDCDYADLRIMPTCGREPLLLNGSGAA
jgi:hypothetical protein